MSISFAVTAYHEMSPERGGGNNLLRCIAAAQQSEAITDIAIVDDASSDFQQLQELLEGAPKVSLYSNQQNLGVFGNKLEAIAQAKGDWVITCDSDNTMGSTYIEKLLRAWGIGRHGIAPALPSLASTTNI